MVASTAERKVVWPKDLPKTYTSPEVAEFFGRQLTWVHWGLRPKVRRDGVITAQPWTYADGSSIDPRREGKRRERRFTLDEIREIAKSRYRRRDLTEAEMNVYLEIIDRVERGEAELLASGAEVDHPPARRRRAPDDEHTDEQADDDGQD